MRQTTTSCLVPPYVHSDVEDSQIWSGVIEKQLSV